MSVKKFLIDLLGVAEIPPTHNPYDTRCATHVAGKFSRPHAYCTPCRAAAADSSSP